MTRKIAVAALLVALSLSACTIPGAPETIKSNTKGTLSKELTKAKATPKATIVVHATVEPTAQPTLDGVMPKGAEAGSPEVLSELAVADLAQRLGIDAVGITVPSVVAHTFNDSSLGVGQPGRMYLQVLTPGYILTLEAGGTSYTYHGTGSRVVYAGGPDATPASKRPVPSSLPVRQEGDVATIYLSHPERSAGDCSLVFAVPRASKDAEVAEGGIGLGELALRALLAGPTEDELAMGYTSAFSAATADALISVTTKGDTAYVNLRDIRPVVTLDDACARLQIGQQLLRTIQGVLPVERVLVALDGDPAAWCDWLNLDCESQGQCDPAPFLPTRIPLRQAAPTIPPAPAPVLDLKAALPEEAEIVRQTSLDMDRDGADEVVVLAGQPSESETMSYDWLKLMVVLPGAEPKVLWQTRTLGDRAMALDLEDINGDGQPEVLSLQSMGASGQTLYILGWRHGSYALLRPQGGYFAGWDSFGEKGVGFEDVTGDGVDEILAAYGPAASKRDVYQWDGSGYVYLATQDYAVQ